MKKLKMPKTNLAPPIEVDGAHLIETTIRHRDGGMTVVVELTNGGVKVGEKPIHIGGDFDFADADILEVVRASGALPESDLEEE